MTMGHVTGLRCKGCGKEFEKKPVAACEECWAALEPIYDLDGIRRTSTRESIAMRPRDLWRYHELLPTDGEPTVGRGTGFTPLIPAPRLGARLGIRDLWIKYDAACHPTLSFKDRLVAVALTKAREFGMDTVGCASTVSIRSEEHTSELQSRLHLVCRLLLEKKKNTQQRPLHQVCR